MTEKKEAKKKATVKKTVKKAELVAETVPAKGVKEELKLEIEPDEAKAKAGKRSAKAAKEAEVVAAKEERKKTGATDDDKPKQAKKPPRSRVERAGKKYRELAKQVDRSMAYSLNEAVELATKTSPTKFDASLELHINLNVDPSQADQNIRGSLVLPSGTGKTQRIAVLADAAEAEKAKAAGADMIDEAKIFAALDNGKIEFDVLIAQPPMMAKLGKYAKLLGPKGLMPNPKSGTVSNDAAGAVKEAKAGRVEYRVDSAGIIHLAIGKVSFGPEKLTKNAEAVLTAVRGSKPGSIKGTFVKSIYVTTTMGPSLRLSET